DDQVHGSVELRQRGARVGVVQGDPAALDDLRYVAPGPGQRVLGQLDRVHPRARYFLRYGQCDRARAAAQVDDDGFCDVQVPQPVDRPADHDLGLRARHEHAGADLQLQIAEEGAAGDVLQRFAVLPAGDRGPEAGVEVAVAHGVQFAAPYSVHPRGQ